MPIAYHNGRLMPEEEVRISPRDRGLLLGDSVFETMPVYGGHVFLLDRHIERLHQSGRAVRLTVPLTQEALTSAVNATVGANAMASGSVRLTVTRGTGPAGIDPLVETTPTVLITVSQPRDLAPLRSGGVDLALSDVVRADPAAVPCGAKTGNMLNSVLGRVAASETGAFEALMLNADGTVAEGAISNVFAIVDGVAHTPPADGRILPGVTRGAVLELCAELGIPVSEDSFGLDLLDAASEIWLTNSLIEVLPVRGFRGRPLPPPWPVWRRVADAYAHWAAAEAQETCTRKPVGSADPP